MSFGFQRQPRIFLHDTARLVAYVYAVDEETLISMAEIENVTFSIKRPEDNDTPAWLLHDGLRIEAVDDGAFGNAFTVTVIDPGVAGSLSAVFTNPNLVITLAHDGVNPTSTTEDVEELLQNTPSIYTTLTATRDGNAPIHDLIGVAMEPLAQTHLAHGEGPIIYRAAGTIDDDGTASYIVPSTITTIPGEYLGMARFTLTDGQIKSVPCDFDVIDPFIDIGLNPADSVVDAAWRKFEDCFDSEMGGPWLRDMTMARFDKSRMRDFIGDALIEINGQMPQTSFTEHAFPYESDDGSALFTQGVLVAAIRHLMRSYTEQPDVMNSTVGFLDRKRYQQAWKAVYDVEYTLFLRWLALYKRRLYTTGARVLVASKAGRLLNAPSRARSAGRGYW